MASVSSLANSPQSTLIVSPIFFTIASSNGGRQLAASNTSLRLPDRTNSTGSPARISWLTFAALLKFDILRKLLFLPAERRKLPGPARRRVRLNVLNRRVDFQRHATLANVANMQPVIMWRRNVHAVFDFKLLPNPVRNLAFCGLPPFRQD